MYVPFRLTPLLSACSLLGDTLALWVSRVMRPFRGLE